MIRKLQSRKKNRLRRPLNVETLEKRHLLASLWQNAIAPLDVNDDALISPLDALLVINRLNSEQNGAVSGSPGNDDNYVDTSGDRFVSPIDALLVINHLNSGSESNGRATAPYVLTERSEVSEVYIPIDLGEPSGVRQLRLGIDADFDMSSSGSALEDSFAIYIVDRYTRETLVDRGTHGTSLFTLSGDQADFMPGQTRFDGQTLDIDISTGAITQPNALLLLQMINADSDLGSKVTVTPISNEVIADATAPRAFVPPSVLESAAVAVDLASLQSNTEITPHFENVRYDGLRDVFTAEVYMENRGVPIGRDVVLVLSQIAGTSVESAISGTDVDGKAYINFRDAIASGGFDHAAFTDRIEIEIDALVNPLRFPFQVLVGANNQAPLLSPLGEINLLPGEKLRVQLEATEPDGDEVRFSIRATDTTPTLRLESDGVLEFSPTPAEIGTHQFDVYASDGLLSSSQTVTVNVLPDSNTSTRVSGRILDVDQTPLAGVRIEIAGMQVLTGSNGSFELNLGSGPVAADTIRVRGDLLSSAAYPFIAEKLPLVLEHELFTGHNNIIHRPIYLPKLDIANGKTISPTQDTLVTTAAIPGASVMVQAGTLRNQSGTLFTDKLTITEVPRDLTPAALPDNLLPDLVVTIQPGEMVFTTPAALSLPNRAGWPAGTIMDLWSINPVTGEFEVVGKGMVSEDGSTVDTIEGGIRNSSWHAFLLSLLETLANTSVHDCETCGPAAPAQSEINLFNGEVTENFNVFSYTSQGSVRQVNLVYSSMRADIRPAIEFMSTMQCVVLAPGLNTPQVLAASVSVNSGSTSSALAEGRWVLPDCNQSGGLVQRGGTLIGDMQNFPSGQYEFELETAVLTGTEGTNFSGAAVNTTKMIPIVNYAASPIGSGWGILGLQHIIEHRDGSLLLVTDSGLNLRFEPPNDASGIYRSPPGDFSQMQKLADGTYRRTLKDQTVYQFNAANRLATGEDRNGNVTEYRYENGRVTEIVDPVGLTTRFNYDNGLLMAIVDPYGRSTEIHHDAFGNLTRIVAPDGSTTSWSYDSRHHTTGMIDANGNIGGDHFDAMGRGIGVSFPDGSRSTIYPMQSMGLPGQQSGVSIGGLPKAVVERETLYIDPQGNTIRMVLDGLGQPVSITDSLGQVSSMVRDANNLVTERFDGRGNQVSYDYDDRGNVVEVSDAFSRDSQSPTLFWVAGSGEWNDPANWSAGRVPGPDDDVVLDVRSIDAVITVSGSAAFAKSLRSQESISIQNTSLTLTNESLLAGSVLIALNSSLVASGPQAVVTIESVVDELGTFRAEEQAVVRLPNAQSLSLVTLQADTLGRIVAPTLTSLLDAKLRLAGGGTLETTVLADITGSSIFVSGANTSYGLPSAISTYSASSSSAGHIFQAELGAQLDLTSITAFTNAGARGYTPSIEAFSGGIILLPNLIEINDLSVSAYASGEGSTIDLSQLRRWIGAEPNFVVPSFLYADFGGVIDADQLMELEYVNISVDATSTIPLTQITSLYGGSLTIQGQTADLANLGSLRNASLRLTNNASVTTPILSDVVGASFYVSGPGTSFVLPSSITAYTTGEKRGDRYLQADNGAVLDLSSLASVDADPLAISTLSFNAYAGGRVLAPNVSQFADDAVYVIAQGTGSEVDLSSVSTWQGLDSVTGIRSVLDASYGGAVDLGRLTAMDFVNVTMKASDTVAPLPLVASLTNCVLSFETGTEITIPSLVDITGSSIHISGLGTKYVLPAAITSYTPGEFAGDRSFQADASAVLDLSSLTTITRHPIASSTIILAAYTGGSVQLPSVSELRDIPVFLIAQGVGSDIDVSSLTDWSGIDERIAVRSVLQANSGGYVNISAVTNLLWVNASFTDPAEASLTQITSWKNGSLNFTSGTFDFTNLLDANDTSFTIDAARVNAPVLTNIGTGQVTLLNDGILDAPNLPGGGSGEGSNGGSGGSGASGGAGSGGNGSGEGNGGDSGGGGDSGSGEGDAPEPQIGQPRTFAYDPTFSQLMEAVDELGRVTVHTIDPANGNRLQTRYIVGLNDLESSETDDQVTSFTYTASGLLDVMTDPLGRVSDWDYDALGRVVRITIAKGTPDEAVMLTEYDAFGNVAAEVDANGNRTEFEYDIRDRLTLLRDAVGNITRYAYDAAGNMVQQTDARGNNWHYKFDRKHRMIESRDPQDNVTNYKYDLGGNLLSTRDPLGNTTNYEYDVRGRRVKTIDPDGGVTRFAYDLDNNLISLTDPVGNTTTFAYDARSRQVSETDPLGKVIQYAYDPVDNLVRKTDRLLRTTNYQYDDLDRLTSETWVGGENQIVYDYDLVDNLVHVKDAFSELTYTYDAQDRVTSVDNAGTPGAPNVVLQYAYDAAGNVLSVTDSIEGTPNAVTGYLYDALNRLATLTQTAAPGASATDIAFLPSDKRVDFTYNPISQYQNIRRYGDLAGSNLVIDTAYAYDNVSRLQSIDHLNASGTAVSFFHYQYDSSSRISQITDIDGVTDYSYDQRDQLIGADHTDPNNPDESYTYDANGNRINSHLHGDGYLTGPANRLLSDGTNDYEYDDEGSMTLRTEIATGATREFQWDYRNRLVGVVDKDADGTATQEVRFTYDALNRRIAKAVDATPGDAVDAVITQFVYDREDVILDFVEADTIAESLATPEIRYLHGEATDFPLNQDAANNALSTWLVHDYLGSVSASIDSSGLVTYYDYDSYGRRTASGIPQTRFAYTGREFDETLNLYFYRARYMDASIGLFIAEDPIGFVSGSTNLNSYVENSTPNFRDPTGNQQENGPSSVEDAVNSGLCLAFKRVCSSGVKLKGPKPIYFVPPISTSPFPLAIPIRILACLNYAKHCIPREPIECPLYPDDDIFGSEETEPKYGEFSTKYNTRNLPYETPNLDLNKTRRSLNELIRASDALDKLYQRLR